MRAEYGALFDELAQLLFERDPIGINFEENTDEYEPEVCTILPRLSECRSAADLRQVVHEEFVYWFTASVAGPPERYAELAEAIWALWKAHQDRTELI